VLDVFKFGCNSEKNNFGGIFLENGGGVNLETENSSESDSPKYVDFYDQGMRNL
jgi:hypothetical protein